MYIEEWKKFQHEKIEEEKFDDSYNSKQKVKDPEKKQFKIEEKTNQNKKTEEI